MSVAFEEDDDNVTYYEARAYMVWLDEFTAETLADAMFVDYAVAERFVFAAMLHGIIEETGEEIGEEEVWRHKPLPAGPRRAFTYPPEWKTTIGVYDLAPVRGMPIRIRSDRETRRKMAGDMSARHRLKMQEKRYQQAEAAKEERAKKQMDDSRMPKWMREKQKQAKKTGGGGGPKKTGPKIDPTDDGLG